MEILLLSLNIGLIVGLCVVLPKALREIRETRKLLREIKKIKDEK